MRGCVWLQWIFFKTPSTLLPISWCVVYECTYLHPAECLAGFDQKWQDSSMPHPPYSPDFAQSNLFCFPEWKESSKGNILLMWKRWNRKNNKAPKGIKINEFKNCFEPWLVSSGLSAGLQPKGSPVRFPVGAHAWVVGQVPSRGAQEATTHWYFSPSLSPPFPSL